MIYNISTTSRTGYARQSNRERIREAIAILVSIATISVIVTAIALLARWL